MEHEGNSERTYRIGVDVGGTNTDAVIVDLASPRDAIGRGIVASFKHATTPDVTTGIELAVKEVMKRGNVQKENILSLTIGTTHFINAVVQSDASKLSKVAVIRLAAPYSDECPSFIDFPANLASLMNGHTAIINGGLQIDGRPINELSEEEVIEQSIIIRKKNLKNVVLVGVYSPLDADGKNEYRARDILRRELGPQVHIVCSRDVGQVGFLERENAAILNASIMSFARKTIRSFREAMARLGLSCPLYLTQNDGTLTTAENATQLPIKTFASGATNSMRGASYLAGVGVLDGDARKKSVLVVDIGGTTTDIGFLLPSGFPRQAAAFIKVAGVRTNFSMPDIYSIGLGGGSKVIVGTEGHVTVGPESVGHQLLRDALTFGGNTLTATDIIASSNPEIMGILDATSNPDVDGQMVSTAQIVIKNLLENAVDRMKTSPEDCDLLLVGGGSIIAPAYLKGVANIIIPPFHEVANAVGAAIASVAGEVDTIEILEGKSLSDTLEFMKAQAIKNASEKGALPSSVKIAEITVLPIQYVTNQATRIIVRAVGDLAVNPDYQFNDELNSNLFPIDVDLDNESQQNFAYETETNDYMEKEVDYENYRPSIEGDIWDISETDLFFIMEGCGVLGTGGGGSPYYPYLISRQIIREGGSIRVVDHKSLSDDAYLARGGFMGSPSVGSERIRGGAHLQLPGKELGKYLSISNISATLCDEIGGGNGLQSLVMSRYYNVPALDGDLMGRAYPRLDQVLPAVYDRPNALVPCSLCDGDGTVVLLTLVKNEQIVERIMRVVTTEMGSSAALCPPPLRVADARDYGVIRSQSQAWRIGRAIAICRQKNNLGGIPTSILQIQNGKCLFVGKIIEVSREVRAGFTWGNVRIVALREDELEELEDERPDHFPQDASLVIPFQNENLCAYLETTDGNKTMIASVPDLITVLDSQSGSHLGTPEYTYGLRVTVIALAGHPLWRTERGLLSGGPAAFGLNHEYIPIAEYRVPRSVIEEYRVAL